eukprot:Unigene9543_Nuclearia_a/m.29149 Unigene9543_Nuclearia_a/g.29149  ORF Unigene9543_Nuclearia_a/g.29149 Unigene9543_Nuclearia_a/m.29149 type:complete len:357 (+) Unigene9543_Nuclearia_a:750-1820(+)
MNVHGLSKMVSRTRSARPVSVVTRYVCCWYSKRTRVIGHTVNAPSVRLSSPSTGSIGLRTMWPAGSVPSAARPSLWSWSGGRAPDVLICMISLDVIRPSPHRRTLSFSTSSIRSSAILNCCIWLMLCSCTDTTKSTLKICRCCVFSVAVATSVRPTVTQSRTTESKRVTRIWKSNTSYASFCSAERVTVALNATSIVLPGSMSSRTNDAKTGAVTGVLMAAVGGGTDGAWPGLISDLSRPPTPLGLCCGSCMSVPSSSSPGASSPCASLLFRPNVCASSASLSPAASSSSSEIICRSGLCEAEGDKVGTSTSRSPASMLDFDESVASASPAAPPPSRRLRRSTSARSCRTVSRTRT